MEGFGFVTSHMCEKVVTPMEQQYANVTNKLITKLTYQFLAQFLMDAFEVVYPQY